MAENSSSFALILSVLLFPLALHAFTLLDPSGKILIVNGTEATPHEFPWLVSIRTSTNLSICSGVILDRVTILTTGGCAETILPYFSYADAGKHNLSTIEDSSQVAQITSVHIHPEYGQSNDYSNDIAVLKIAIAQPFTWTQYVTPISNLQEAHSITEEEGIIAGWGTKREEDIYGTDILQKATVKIIPNNEDCQQLIGSQLIIEESMVCIASPTSSVPVDSCTGDQGGPLITKHEDGTVVLSGLISFGIGCGRPNMPSFCTRISPYIDFIRRYMENQAHS